MVEFASTDWQSILSGVNNLATGAYNESVSAGHTSSLKGKSGYVTGIVRGALGTASVPSYRGIENFFGNIWKLCNTDIGKVYPPVKSPVYIIQIGYGWFNSEIV